MDEMPVARLSEDEDAEADARAADVLGRVVYGCDISYVANLGVCRQSCAVRGVIPDDTASFRIATGRSRVSMANGGCLRRRSLAMQCRPASTLPYSEYTSTRRCTAER